MIKELEGELVEFYVGIQNQKLEADESIRLNNLMISIRHVMSSAAEAECGGTFENARTAIPIRYILQNILKHPQPPRGVPIVTDNNASRNLLTQLIKPKKSKTWDMRYHWLEDRIQRKYIPENRTWWITLRSIIHRHIIKKPDRTFSHHGRD